VLKNYITFFRIHTASLTIPVVWIAYIVSTHAFNWVEFLFIGIFALLFHAFGFAWNNLLDYKWDKEDRFKQHFPLVSGDIKYTNARNMTVVATVLSAVFGVFVASFSVVPLIMMTAAIGAGFGYNILNKTNKYAMVLISLSFSFLAMYGYTIGNGGWQLAVMIFLFAFFTMMYQISVSGNIKDAEINQANILKVMGLKLIAGNIIIGKRVFWYSTALRLTVIATGIAMLIFLHEGIIVYVIAAVMMAWTLLESNAMLRHNEWVRDWFLKRMSRIEIVNYLTFAFLFLGVYGLIWTTFFVVFPIAWFVVFNRIMWGSSLFPRV